MSQFTYNIITQEVSWDCPHCQRINSFAVEEKPIILVCTGCGFSFSIDPLRYVQFKAMNNIFEEELIKCLGSQKTEN